MCETLIKAKADPNDESKHLVLAQSARRPEDVTLFFLKKKKRE